MSTPLGEHVLSIIRRHPGLSMRRASIEAGLNENAIQQIIKGIRSNPLPDTLKAIADTWGTPQDYYEMMRLAGYDTPLPPDVDDPVEAKMLTLFKALSDEEKDRVLEMLWALNRKDTDVTPIALRAGELDERGQHTILEMIEYIRKAQELEHAKGEPQQQDGQEEDAESSG